MCLWTALSYGVHHGPGTAIEAGGAVFVDTMGAYLLGRIFVRTTDDFYKVVRLLFWITILNLPFALMESVTGRNVALELFQSIYRTHSIQNMEPRWGLRRAQTVFEHPILLGVFCSSIVAMTYFVLSYGHSLLRRLIQTGLVVLAAGLSLSSGPMTAMAAQIGLIGWDRVFRSIRVRWWFLGGLFVSFIASIQIMSNRSPAQILISIVAFRKESAWNRLRIWDYGSASVVNHPLFGIGRNDWERPRFMTSSIDMFWLVPAVRNGLASGLLLQIAFFGVFLAVLFRKGLTSRDADYRTGFLISMLGIYLAGWTVHYWNSVYVLLVFLLGCGYCFLNQPGASPNMTELSPDSGPPTRVYSRQHRGPETAVAPPRSPNRYSRQPHVSKNGEPR
jgi:hypothetical protein